MVIQATALSMVASTLSGGLSCHAENWIGFLMIDPCEGLDLHVAAGGPPFIASLERHGAVEASRSGAPSRS